MTSVIITGCVAAAGAIAVYLVYSAYENFCIEYRRKIRHLQADAEKADSTIRAQRREINRLNRYLDDLRDLHAEEITSLRNELAVMRGREKIRQKIDSAKRGKSA